MHHARVVAVLAVTLSTVVAAGDAATLHVRPGGAGDGTSWESALPAVQAALDKAVPGDEVWVATGTYQETLTVPDRVALYGGFAGTETVREHRNPAARVTVLLMKEDGPNVTVPAASSRVTVDGFTIARTLEHDPTYRAGGGVNVLGPDAVISGNIIKNNFAPGVTCGGANALVEDNVLLGNQGGVRVTGLSATIRRNRITNNAAQGGGIAATSATLVITGNIISGNQSSASGAYWCHGDICQGEPALAYGGGLYLSGCTGRLANNAIVGNSVSAYAGPGMVALAWGGGLYMENCRLEMVNNTIADNRLSGENRLGGSIAGSGNTITGGNNLLAFNDEEPTTEDPLFVDRANGDYRLKPASPAIDAGDNALVQPGDRDANGAPRVQGAHADLGAYEAEVGTTPAGLLFGSPLPDAGTGEALPVTPLVAVVDVYGRRVPVEGRPVEIAIKAGTGTSGAKLAGTMSMATVHGLVRFEGLSIDRAGGGYVLQATSGIVTPGVSNAFRVLGPLVGLAFTTQPPDGRQTFPLPGPVVVSAVDSAGQPMPEFNGLVTLSIKPGTGGPGATLSGVTSREAVKGVATFDGQLTLDKAGTDYVLLATASGLPAAESRVFVVVPVPTVVRVSTRGNDANDGSHWTLAKRTIGAAASAVMRGGEVWVEQGTYGPASFDGIALYGGFDGTETAREQRDWRAHPTVLDGTNVDRAVQMGYARGAVLDGFAVRARPGATGGAVFSYSGGSVIAHNVVTGSFIAEQGGGARVSDNLVLPEGTAGISVNAGSTVTNNTVVGALAGITLTSNNITMANNIVVSCQVGARVHSPGNAVVRNNCLYNNGVNYDLSWDWTGMNGNIAQDPLFADAAGGDYRLLEPSPCLDTGDDASAAASGRDLDAAPRLAGAHVDMGAYEKALGALTIRDLRAALRAASGLDACSPDQKARLDMDGSGAVDMMDAARVAAAVRS